MLDYVMVGLGGALGAISRVGLSKVIPAQLFGIPIPVMLINILGCFMMGVSITYIELYNLSSSQFKNFLIAGFLGAFTTFSAFSQEFGFLYNKELYLSALFYSTLTFVLCILSFFVGAKLIQG